MPHPPGGRNCLICAGNTFCMIAIKRATPADCAVIAAIGLVAVEAAHRDSSPAKDLQDYLAKNYTDEAIREELSHPEYVYHIIYVDDEPAGFSKIQFNAAHPAIAAKNVTKLDRIYLLSKFFDKKLGGELLQFNIDLCKQHQQSGIWLYTWTGNHRAIQFYLRKGFVNIGSHQFKVSETHSNLNHHLLLSFGE